MGRRFLRLRSRIDPAGTDTATASFRPRLPPELEFATDRMNILDSHRQKIRHQPRRDRSETYSYLAVAWPRRVCIIWMWRGIPICV